MTSIQFPTDNEAIDYAESNGISLSEIHFQDDNWCINDSSPPDPVESIPKRKSCQASKLGNYTGIGFVVRTNWSEPQYDTGIRKHPKSPLIFDALVYFNQNDAKRTTRFCIADKSVEKVWIENGKIKRILV